MRVPGPTTPGDQGGSSPNIPPMRQPLLTRQSPGGGSDVAPPPQLQKDQLPSAGFVGSPFSGFSSPAMRPINLPGSSVFSFGAYQVAPMLQVVGGQTLPPRAGPRGPPNQAPFGPLVRPAQRGSWRAVVPRAPEGACTGGSRSPPGECASRSLGPSEWLCVQSTRGCLRSDLGILRPPR